MGFVDEARIWVAAGDGGDGAVAFHREPYKPKGGPDGGDGGDGGDVVIYADPSVSTLVGCRDRPHVKAAGGAHGKGKRRHGARGQNQVVRVPPGTLVYEDGTLLADLAAPGDSMVAARGGRGGRGNARFATSTRQAPRFAEKGEPGERLSLRLELRLLADVGLVGFPNSGKSTLVASLSSARPRIAAYPFTTLEPSLGVVRRGERSFVIADIPGLVSGAHEGRGLGDRFLRHISRAAVLVFVVDLGAADRDPVDDVDALRRELEGFDEELLRRRSLVVANKVDAYPEHVERVRARVPDALVVSALTHQGLDALVERLFEAVAASRRDSAQPRGYVRHVSREDPVRIEREDGAWRVRGRRAERAVAVTDLDNDEAVRRMQRRLISIGVERALAEAGAAEGDEVRIGHVSFDFEPEPGVTS
jgi:GTP-binding protein